MSTMFRNEKSITAVSDNYENVQLIVFTVADEEYAVNVSTMREIIRLPRMTLLPTAPDYIEGAISLRGNVVPLISLAKQFGLPSQEVGQIARVLIMETLDGSFVGFIVDGVSEVIRVMPDTIHAPPENVSNKVVQDSMLGLINHNEKIIVLLNLQHVHCEIMTRGAS